MKAGMASLILLAAVLAAVMALRPGWLIPGQPQPPASRPQVEVVLAPDRRIVLLHRRRADKEEVARRLYHGELTLLEAAGRFRLLNASPPGLEDVGVMTQPGGGDGERLCNQAISWAAVTINDHPQPEVEARIEVLRRELHDHVAMHGGIKLPEAGAE
jgi:hypothetical protein